MNDTSLPKRIAACRAGDNHSLPAIQHIVRSEKLVRQRSYWRHSGEYVQRCVCFVNMQSSLHEKVVFSVCACLGNAMCIIFIMLNSISSLDAWYHFRFNISCGVAVLGRSHQKKNSGNFLRGGERGKKNCRGEPIV